MKIENLTDQQIIDQYQKKGDQIFIGDLYKKYMHLVYGLCLKYLKNREEAQDAVMSIYEKISVELKAKEVTHFKSWLYMVSKNYCLMELRKKNPEENVEIFMEIADDVHLYDEKINLERDLSALEDCMQDLKNEQQDCVSLFYLEKKSYNEISKKLKMDLLKVKSYIQNGKRNLKNCLEAKNVKG